MFGETQFLFTFILEVMKKMTKILLAAGGAALICGGSVMTYLKAQAPMSIQEELTLANLEAMAIDDEGVIDIGGVARWWVLYTDSDGSHICKPKGSAECLF